MSCDYKCVCMHNYIIPMSLSGLTMDQLGSERKNMDASRKAFSDGEGEISTKFSMNEFANINFSHFALQ